MKRLLALGFLLALPLIGECEPDFPVTPDSKPQENNPKGELLKFQLEESRIFPGTTREVTVYVPRQYDGIKPACVYVNQDGVQWSAPTVFDNLIAKGEIPVLVGVFIKPGVVKAIDEKAALPRFNRSLEYDGLGPDYAEFVLNEILPAVEKLSTADGRKIILSKSGNDRAIGGSSSGAICAFTAAWERPEAFSRVFNVVCTMVGLRGANEYPSLIRKYEPKPIRVFQQDGSNDLNIYGGDWWMANQELERALTFAGYEHEHVWGEGGHNGKHGTAVFPDAMRFLWKGWPETVKTGPGNNKMLNDILSQEESWQLVYESRNPLQRVLANARGEVFVSDRKQSYKLDAKGNPSQPEQKLHCAAGPGETFYDVEKKGRKLIQSVKDSKPKVVAAGMDVKHAVALSNGNIYVTESSEMRPGKSSVWLVRPDGKRQQVVENSSESWLGITASTDQSLLYINDARSHWVYSFVISTDGTLSHKQRYYWLHTPDTADDAGAGGMQVDTDGRLYVASRLGVQVCDQAGRVNVILPTPAETAHDLVFGGETRDTLYVIAGNKLFKRKLKIHGAFNAAAPSKPAAPHL